jgi:cytochrome P450
MILALPTRADGWTDLVDLQPLNFRLTIDSASEFLFGESVNSQLAALPGGDDVSSARLDDAAFVTAFELSQDIIAKAFRFNDWYSIGLTKQYYAACKVCHRYIDRFVRQGLSHEKRLFEPKTGDKYVFLEALAAQTTDPVEIRDQLLSILVAGRDTTASLLSFLFLVLSQNQDVFRKLRQIIVKEFGTYDAPKNVTFSNLKACSYLQWCLNETLRLYPTVPLNSRRSIVDTTLPRGGGPDGLSPVFVPKGTEVNYSVYATHRNEAFWGKDASEFRPERWNGRKPGFEYLPFNGGPR